MAHIAGIIINVNIVGWIINIKAELLNFVKMIKIVFTYKYMVIVNNTINKILLSSAVILVIGFSFSLGKSQASKVREDNSSQYTSKIEELNKTIESLSKDAKNIEDFGFYFPTYEEAPTCTPQYPIKIKVTKGEYKYYPKNHKLYSKVKGDICTVSEIMAKKIKGIKLAQ